MDADSILQSGNDLKRRSADLDFLREDLRFCKCLKFSEGGEGRPVQNSDLEETCEETSCRVPTQQRFSKLQGKGAFRFLYIEKGNWREFPHLLNLSLMESFLARKSYTRFSLQNKVYVVSFVYMVQLNLHTGFAQSIAWIDRNGEFITPAKCIEQSYSRLLPKLLDGTDGLAVEALRGDARLKSLDSILSSVQTESITCGFTSSCCDFATLGDKIYKLNEDDKEFSVARDMLLSGYSLFSKDVSVLQTYRCSHSNLWGQAKLQAFKMQEKITSATRGDPNIRYAWHGSSKEGIVGIIRHGFGQPRVPKNGDAFGVGVYLAPENASHVSAMYSDVDESGEQHILLCKVIMGRMEQVPLGSQQFHPSSEDFDSGVDDVTRPKRYIVWSTHMNTHILPQFIISFKLSTSIQEVIVAAHRGEPSLKEAAVSSMHSKDGHECDTAASELSYSHHDHIYQYGESHKEIEQCLREPLADCASTVCDVELMASCSIQSKVKSPKHICNTRRKSCANGPSFRNIPRSPWISFPELFPMLESKLEPQAMDVLQKLHMKFQVGRLPRNLFVKMIRHMLGDDFLRECIKNRSVQPVSTSDTQSFC